MQTAYCFVCVVCWYMDAYQQKLSAYAEVFITNGF